MEPSDDLMINYFLASHELDGDYPSFDDFKNLLRNADNSISDKPLAETRVRKLVKELDDGTISDNKLKQIKSSYNNFLKIAKKRIGNEVANKTLKLKKHLEKIYSTGERPTFDDYKIAISESTMATRGRQRLLQQFNQELSKETEDKLEKDFDNIMEELDNKRKVPVKPHGNIKRNPNFNYTALTKKKKAEFDKAVAEMKERVKKSRETGNRQNVYSLGVRTSGGKKGVATTFGVGDVVAVVREQLSVENIQEIGNAIIAPEIAQIREIQNNDLMAKEEKEERIEAVIEEAKEKITQITENLTVEENNDLMDMIEGDVVIDITERPELYAQFLMFAEVANLNMRQGTPIPSGYYNNVYKSMDNDLDRDYVSRIMRQVASNVGNNDISVFTPRVNNFPRPIPIVDNVIMDIPEPTGTFKNNAMEGGRNLAIAGLVGITILAAGSLALWYFSGIADDEAKKKSKVKELQKILGVSSSEEMDLALEKMKKDGIVPNETSLGELLTVVQKVSDEELQKLMNNEITPGEFVLDFIVSTPINTPPPLITTPVTITTGLPTADFNTARPTGNTLIEPVIPTPLDTQVLGLPTTPINNNYTDKTLPNIMNFQTAYKTYEGLPEYIKAYMTKEQYDSVMYNKGALPDFVTNSMSRMQQPALNGLLSNPSVRVPTHQIPIRDDRKFLSSFPINKPNSSADVVLKDGGYQNMIGTSTHLNTKGGDKFKSVDYYKIKQLNNEQMIGTETSLIKSLAKSK